MGLVLTLYKTLRIYENIIPVLKKDAIIDHVRKCGQTEDLSVLYGSSVAHTRGNIL